MAGSSNVFFSHPPDLRENGHSPHTTEPSSPPPRLLFADDEPANLESLVKICAKEGITAAAATNGSDALNIIRHHPIDVLVTDLMMPGMTGLELMRAVKALRPETTVIFITAYGTVESAVSAMKDGAYDFITKPLKRQDILKVIRRALERADLVAENQALKASLAELTSGGKKALIGQSPAFRRVMEMMRQAAPSTATILLLGESGTGKELFARAIHENSPREKSPFIAVNCGAIPETLLESELFGYEKGAFTGAIARKEGRFERANGGTIFLDEIGEMPLSLQVKILRVLQEGEVERLGGQGPIPIDIRIVAGTNLNLEHQVAEGRFRSDLFYRLNVVPITLPPLRQRREDIPLLANHFLKRYGAKNQKNMAGFTPRAMASLENYLWPGNIRELENAVERAVVLSQNATIDVTDLPESLANKATVLTTDTITIPFGTPLEDAEMKIIQTTLQRTGGDKNLAASILGITARTIYRKLDRKTSEGL